MGYKCPISDACMESNFSRYNAGISTDPWKQSSLNKISLFDTPELLFFHSCSTSIACSHTLSHLGCVCLCVSVDRCAGVRQPFSLVIYQCLKHTLLDSAYSIYAVMFPKHFVSFYSSVSLLPLTKRFFPPPVVKPSLTPVSMSGPPASSVCLGLPLPVPCLNLIPRFEASDLVLLHSNQPTNKHLFIYVSH